MAILICKILNERILQMINKMRWKLIKPENDFIALEDELRNLHFAQRTYQMFGTRRIQLW